MIKIFYEKNNLSNTFLIKYIFGLLELLVAGNNEIQNNKDIFNENDIIIVLFKAYSKEKITTALFLVLNLLSEVDSKNNFVNIAYLRDFFERIFRILL